jgi:tRNA modification GTPase
VDQVIGRVCYGQWGLQSPEDVVLSRLREDAVEIHCHGGRAAVARILADLAARGVEIESVPAYAERTSSLLDAECARALGLATTERSAMFLAEQAAGVLQAYLEQVLWDLELSPHTPERDQQVDARLEELIRWSGFARHLTMPWAVVLVGRPNVGKSSLINALAGFERSIVSPLPGTTRDVVTTQVVFDGWTFELSDTAGLRAATDAIEAEGIARTAARLATADLKLLLLDRSAPLADEDRQLLVQHPDALTIVHKCDLPPQWETACAAGALALSSRTGMGVGELAKAMVGRLVPCVPPPGTPLPVTPRIEEVIVAARRALRSGQRSNALALLRQLLRRPG